MATKLWTPDRDIDISSKELSTNIIPQQDMEIIAHMHRIAQKLGIGMHCMKCDRPFQGFNSEVGRTWAISCGCRQVKATVRSGVVV